MSMNARDQQSSACSWVGIDVSAKSFDVCLVAAGADPGPAQIKRLPTSSFERTPAGVQDMLGMWADQDALHMVMESTGRYSVELAQWILDASQARVRISVVNPRRVSAHSKALGLRSKTDPIDARVIASYALHMRPEPWKPPAETQQALVSLTRMRHSLVEQRTGIENQVRDLRHQPFLTNDARTKMAAALESVVETFKQQIAALEQQIADLVKKSPEIANTVELADSVPGIGKIIATTLMAELGDMNRFSSRREIETFAGLNVAVRQSGKCLKQTVGLAKEGSHHVRCALYLAAMATIRGKNVFADDYRKLIAQNKPKKVAIGALMRKILLVVRRVVTDGESYNETKHKNPRSGQKQPCQPPSASPTPATTAEPSTPAVPQPETAAVHPNHETTPQPTQTRSAENTQTPTAQKTTPKQTRKHKTILKQAPRTQNPQIPTKTP